MGQFSMMDIGSDESISQVDREINMKQCSMIHINSEETNSSVDKELEKSLFMKVDTNISIESVILSEENKRKISEFLVEIENADKFIEYGLEPMNRLLFYGASGCGKTYLGKALSNKLGYQMLYVDIAEALSNNSVAKNIKAAFEIANKGNTIIFLDECDSIAWNRNSDANDTGTVRRATNALFQAMDQMNPKTVIICATNMLARLDPAFERRFNLKMRFERPKGNLVDTITEFLLSGFELINDCTSEQVRIIGNRTSMSFYEIQIIVERAMKRAIIQDRKEIPLSDIFKDIAETMDLKLKFGTDTDDNLTFQRPVR